MVQMCQSPYSFNDSCFIFPSFYDPTGKMTITELITSNYVRLTSKLDGDSLCSTFLHKGLISQYTYDTYQKTKDNKILLEGIRKVCHTKKKILMFLEALLEKRQEHLLLKEDGKFKLLSG